MHYFPLFFDVKDRDILLFGGGTDALHKIRKLLPFSPHITVIACPIDGEIRRIPGIRCVERDFRESDLAIHPVFAVIAEDPVKTARIAHECRLRHIPVNAVDQVEFCDFIFPSVVERDHLCIGISSGGRSPTATVCLKESVDAMLPGDIDHIIEWMSDVRTAVAKAYPDKDRKRLLKALFLLAVQNNRPLTEDETRSVIESL